MEKSAHEKRPSVQTKEPMEETVESKKKDEVPRSVRGRKDSKGRGRGGASTQVTEPASATQRTRKKKQQPSENLETEENM